MARGLQNYYLIAMTRYGKYLAYLLAGIAMLVIAASQNPAFSQGMMPEGMPVPRIGMCSARIGEKVYLIGGATGRAQSVQGYDGFRGTSVVEAFDFNSMSWDTSVASLNTPRTFATAVAIHDSIFVMGGIDDSGRVLSSVELYDQATNTWKYVSSMNHPRQGAASVVVGRHILVFGGAGGLLTGLYREVEAYSIDDDEWESTAPMLFGHAFHKVFITHGLIYIFGGISDVTSIIGPYGIIEKYRPGTGPTQVGITLHVPRILFGMVARGDSLYLISGQGGDNGPVAQIELLDVHDSTNEVDTELDSTVLDSPRVGFEAALGPDGRVYLFGGITPSYRNGQVPISTVSVISGIYGVTAVRGTNAAVPKGFSLYQNYPNPFNPATTVEFEVPSGGTRVTIEVFNLLGQRVATLVDGFVTEGRHFVVFNGANMSSGTYIYRMKTENGITYRKMVLLK